MPMQLISRPTPKSAPFGHGPINRHHRSLGKNEHIQWVDKNLDFSDSDSSISSEEGVTTCPNSGWQSSISSPKNSLRQCIWTVAEIASDLRALPSGEELEALIEGGDDILVTSYKHAMDTGILLAAWLDKYYLLKTILSLEGAMVNVMDAEGRTPLHLACYSGAADCCKLLLQHGASVHQWDKHRRATPLQCAASAGNLECVCHLLQLGADVNVGLEVRSSLHYAVQSEAVDCVRELLMRGACPNTPQVFTETPLHVAAALGSAQCVRLLLEHGADVRVQFGQSKVTPLHLAAEDGNAECVQLLLDASAEINAANSRKQTPLHLAALSQSGETMELLLSRGANINEEDIDGRTPLHCAIVKVSKCCEHVHFLLDSGALVNKPDAFGYTPLHIAALNEFSNCVYLLLKYGGDVTAKTKGGVSALSFIVRRTPDILPRFIANLDASIKLHNHNIGDVDCELQMDFRILVPNVERGESELLLSFIEVGQRHILKHPLCETFLFLKWRRIRKFFLVSLVFHAIFVLLFSTYVMGVFVKNGPKTTNNTSEHSTPSPSSNTNYCKLPIITSVAGYLLLALNTLLLAKEIFQMCHGWSVYIRCWENWLQWLVIISTFLCVVHPYGMKEISEVPIWQYHVAAIGIFLVWLQMMMLVGRFPMFGLYGQLLTTVAVNFAKFFIACSCLFIAFGLSFEVIFSNHKPFQNVFWGIMKTVVMMSGELDFASIFYSDIKDEAIQYPVTAQIMFLSCVLLMTIILTNLMVGLAVSDIQGLQQSAGLDKLVRQAAIIAHIESMLYSRLLKCLPNKLLLVCQRSSLLLTASHNWMLYLRPNDPRESRIPRDLVKRAYCLVVEDKEEPKYRTRKHSKISHCSSLRAKCNNANNCLSVSIGDSQNVGMSQKINNVFAQLSALQLEAKEREAVMQEKLQQLTAQIHSVRDEFKKIETNSNTFSARQFYNENKEIH